MNTPDQGCKAESETPSGDEMKRAQVRQRIEQYYYQLTDGCGDSACTNIYCCSNVQVEPLAPNQAAARAVHLLTVSAPLCQSLRHKVRRTSASRASTPPSTSAPSATAAGPQLLSTAGAEARAVSATSTTSTVTTASTAGAEACAASAASGACAASTVTTAAACHQPPSAAGAEACAASGATIAGPVAPAASTASTAATAAAAAHGDVTTAIASTSVTPTDSDANATTEWTADRLIRLVQASANAKDYTPVIRAIGHIFSDAETLKRSFLRVADAPEKGELDAGETEAGACCAADEPPPLDLTSVRRVFSLLFGTGDSPFTAALVTALTTLADGLRTALQFCDGYRRDPHLLNVFLLVMEVPALSSSEFLELALPRLCQAASWLPLQAQARLVRAWSRYPADRLRDMVQTLQQLVSVKVMEAEAAARRGYQATDDEAVAAPVRLMRLLYYASIVGGRCDRPTARDRRPPSPPPAASSALDLHVLKERTDEQDMDPLERELDVRPIDCRVPLVSFDEFYNEPLSEVVEMDHDYRYYKEYPERFCFMRHPFVLTPATKSLGLYYDSRIRMYHERHLAIVHNMVHGAGQPYLRLRVRRDFIIEDALIELEIIALESPDELKKQLVVQFEGEQGVDEGGVSKEFFQLIVEAIFNPDYGMFTFSEETRTYWFNPTSFENDAQFTLIGIVVGLALYNNVILDMRFPMVVYRKLMGQKGTFEDLNELSPTLYRSLSSMLEYEDDDMEEMFMQTFQIGYTDVFGAKLTHDLRPDGSQVVVDRTNVQEFADSYADFLLNQSVERQFRAFRRGFTMVTDESPLWGLFRPDEVELLVCGSKDYDFRELEAGTEYDGGFTKDSLAVRQFWEVVHEEMSEEQRRRLLAFTTGSDRVPVGGLRKLKLIIARNGPDTDRLPTAHTCFNVLLLPEYRGREKIRDMVLKAISYCQGFGML